MRRALALASLAVVAATAAPASAAWQIPPRVADCDIAQNCVCTTINRVAYIATGDYLFHCV